MRSEVSPPGPSRLLEFAGFRYWTASILPALVGTTLPFWLLPSGFSFRWLAALEFLLGTLLIQTGFSLFHARLRDQYHLDLQGLRLLRIGGLCILAGCLLGLHLNSGLSLHNGVPRYIFIIYGLAILMAGALYVAPPFSFWRRAGGEVVLAEGHGLLPLLGAYLVQVGDISRTVYLASLPLVVATGLWIWTEELITQEVDEKQGRQTMVILFGPRFSAQYETLALSALFYVSLFVAVLSASIGPLALATVLTFELVRRLVVAPWRDYETPVRMLSARGRAFSLHLVTGMIMIISSLVPLNS